MKLFAPGPVPVLEEIRNAQTKEMITHRSKEFTQLYADLCGRLTNYFGSSESYVLTGSGALGLEALIANLTFKDQNMICFPNGEFGEKLVETAKIYTNAHSANNIYNSPAIDGGKGWNLERAKTAIDNSNAQVLGMAYNETSYGVRNHIKEICKYAKSKGMLTIIDGISAWPGTEFNMNEFYVDAFVTGSQKGIAAPPGMALIGLNKEAVEVFSKRPSVPSYYLDLRRHKKQYEKDQQTPNTPAISLFWALQKAFDVLDAKGGIKECVKRHAFVSEHVRKKLVEMGFGLVAEKGFESNTVTGFVCKSAEEAKTVKERLEKEFKVKIVGCRGVYKETGLRIAHMGNFDMKDIDYALECIKKIKG